MVRQSGHYTATVRTGHPVPVEDRHRSQLTAAKGGTQESLEQLAISYTRYVLHVIPELTFSPVRPVLHARVKLHQHKHLAKENTQYRFHV